jgi:hypothetical protein
LGQAVAVIPPGVAQVPGQEIAQLQQLKKFGLSAGIRKNAQMLGFL